ncbi:efflux RND transporter periplasmic adaptor subunit [Belliella kenyensis]|uniref:Efflux RND transporter periplasmic adaptor subunit n=1 Tax=Belliella kenyensis TaxID=1472724 RepID=A0ABV8ELJ4_9BACT|nr:efflux RND transporter periplasmic adaptor subunit [Belliella kenyensis]MCH7400319.1 efflux RND transporter periplasmic adaptor subunit [Belliella kenyensis]MDN3604663.1 efflux RND transporter periplasmic adaptor subunit [Belliella kenyensis]
MKKLIIVVLLLSGVAATAYTLYNNKVELNETAEIAMKTSDFISVTTEEVQPRSIVRNFTSNGVFEPFQELQIMSEASGKVTQIFKKKGDYVKKGEVIIQIDDRLIRSEYNITKLNKDQSEKDLKRYINLAQSEAITKKQFEDIEMSFQITENQLLALEKRLDDTKIKAPISGFINEDFYEIGTFLSPGMPVVNLINKNPLKLRVNVSESEIARIKLGEEVNISANAIPNEKFKGKIEFISEKADASFKYEVRILLNQGDTGKIRPGMYGTASFEFAQKENVLQLSRKSIVGSLKEPGVFVINNDVATYRKVQINPLKDGYVEIVEGLASGDEVISSGLINIKEGTKVKVQ